MGMIWIAKESLEGEMKDKSIYDVPPYEIPEELLEARPGVAYRVSDVKTIWLANKDHEASVSLAKKLSKPMRPGEIVLVTREEYDAYSKLIRVEL